MSATPTPPRVPGFPAAPAGSPRTAATSRGRAAESKSPILNPRSGTRPLSVRVLGPLLAEHKRLLRQLEDDGFDTTLTESIQALLHTGPQDAATLRDAIRTWRRAITDL